jgi:hypothetical protein
LVETVTALTILAFFTSGVLVVIDRCLTSAADMRLRMHAFEVARENMEKLLAAESLKESVENGESEKYPDIKWRTTVETFYEPVTSRMWIRGVCTAEYEDSKAEEQTVELTHWLTDLTREQLLELAKRDQQEQGAMTDQLIETLEDAAEYVGVDVETIEKWVNNGLLVTDDGAFVKQNLDLYKQAGGDPAPEQQKTQIQSKAQLTQQAKQSSKTDQPGDQQTTDEKPVDEEAMKNEIDPTTGLTIKQIEQMDFQQLFELLRNRQKK